MENLNEVLTELVLGVAREENLQGVHDQESILYGPGAVLDSFALVRFIVVLESAVEEKFGITVVLASQNAMSQKRSPFRTVQSLASYIEEILKEGGWQDGHAG